MKNVTCKNESKINIINKASMLDFSMFRLWHRVIGGSSF